MKIADPQTLEAAIRRLESVVFTRKGLTFPLFVEEHDWIVVIEVLRKYGLLEYKERPPLKALTEYIHSKHIAERIPYQKNAVSAMSKILDGEEYPWSEVKDPAIQQILPRWRVLYHDFCHIIEDEMRISSSKKRDETTDKGNERTKSKDETAWHNM